MIVHRDYRSSADSIVKIFPDKIEFYNPGSLPDDITIEDLMANTYRSNPSNKAIADFCKDLGMIEKYGSGMCRVVTYFDNEDRPTPHFQNQTSGFVATVYSSNAVEKSVEKIVRLISINLAITQKQLEEATGLTRRGIEKNLKNLKDKNIIQRIGPDNGGFWKVVDES